MKVSISNTEMHTGCRAPPPGRSLEDSLLRKLSSLRAKPIHPFPHKLTNELQTGFPLLHVNTSQSLSQPRTNLTESVAAVAGVTLGQRK